jgi:hypothetical protein
MCGFRPLPVECVSVELSLIHRDELQTYLLSVYVVVVVVVVVVVSEPETNHHPN